MTPMLPIILIFCLIPLAATFKAWRCHRSANQIPDGGRPGRSNVRTKKRVIFTFDDRSLESRRSETPWPYIEVSVRANGKDEILLIPDLKHF